MALSSYRTLMKRADDEFIVNKSRFIGHGKPVESEEEALAFLREMREAYKDASHNCYAYIIGANMGVMRYSDDGEPGGTAGMPIIEVMKNRGVTNACVVVTRYFGGVLLGVGGLVRAYTQGAAMAVNACGVGVMHPTARYLMDVPYPLLSRVEYFFKSAPVAIEGKDFSDVITFTFLVKTQDEEALLQDLTQLSEGRLEPMRFDEIYSAWREDA
ncbi:MAG: YigZ family protein [Clostridia bacterium]|nr:YigZ family protein [Clostridia bacterium]